MATKIVRYSQELQAKSLDSITSPIGIDDMSNSLVNGAVHVSFIPVDTPKFCGLKTTIGNCLWSNQSNFRNLFAKEIYKVFRHVRTPSLAIVLQHRTLGGELLTVQYRVTADEMYSVAGIPPAAEDGKDPVFDLCLEITDRMILQLIDSMSFSIKPSYHSIDTAKPVVPYDDTVDNFMSCRTKCDGTASTLEQSEINDLKTEIDDLRNKMFEVTAVPADRMNQDYETAKDIIDGKFDKYLGKEKKPGKSEVNGDSMFKSSKSSWI